MGPKAASGSQPGKWENYALVPTKPRTQDNQALVLREKGPNSATSTTSKALILRNGKFGARGTGEVANIKKLSGPQKLALKAKEIETALKAPFRLDVLQAITRSQLEFNLDLINALENADFFHDDITAALKATPASLPNNSGGRPDLLKDQTFIAKTIGSRVHNTYMLASAWKIAYSILADLSEAGVYDDNIRLKLDDPSIREQYLALYDLVKMIVDVQQRNVALMASASPQYAKFFQASKKDKQAMEFRNNLVSMLAMHRSLIDTIIIEISLPNSGYSLHTLVACLRDAIDTTVKEERKFTQALYDAVGDLSEALQTLDLLTTPLAHPDGERWIQGPRGKVSSNLDSFLDSVSLSYLACQNVDNFKKCVFPRSQTKLQAVVDNIWKAINSNCKNVSGGKDLDHLWQLQDDRKPVPEWSVGYNLMLDMASDAEDDDDWNDNHPPQAAPGSLVRYKKKGGKGGKKKAPLRISDRPHPGSDDSDEPPDLITTDDSSDEDNLSDHMPSDIDEDDENYESDWDDDAQNEIKAKFAEALRSGFVSKNGPPPDDSDIDDTDARKKLNPFMKMFYKLAGRMFSTDPALKISKPGAAPPPKAEKPAPKKPPTPQSKYPPGVDSDDELPPLVPLESKGKPSTTTGLQSRKVTVEEVEDEGDDAPKAKKKKKKPKKKKKKPTSPGADAIPEADEDSELEIEQEATPAPPPAPTSVPTSPAKSTPTRKPSVPAPARTTPNAKPGFASTTSLHLPVEQKAESARSYLQSQQLDQVKTKVKSRPDQSSTSLVLKPSSFGFGKKKDKVEGQEVDHTKKKKGIFSDILNIPKKTASLMGRVLGSSQDEKQGKAGMRWEHFVKAMVSLGFTYDPSTAGSSVRFMPPNPNDPPITFHKPHPDTTISPHMLKQYGYRLKDRYGWDRETFNGFQGAPLNTDDAPLEEIE